MINEEDNYEDVAKVIAEARDVVEGSLINILVAVSKGTYTNPGQIAAINADLQALDNLLNLRENKKA